VIIFELLLPTGPGRGCQVISYLAICYSRCWV